MLATISTMIGQREVVRAVDPEVDAAVPDRLELRLAIGKMSVPGPLVDLHDQHLQHQREPEDRRREAEEAEASSPCSRTTSTAVSAE